LLKFPGFSVRRTFLTSEAELDGPS
jgi:hypothetical protein